MVCVLGIGARKRMMVELLNVLGHAERVGGSDVGEP